jgi:cytoskeleton protein RodZ
VPPPDTVSAPVAVAPEAAPVAATPALGGAVPKVYGAVDAPSHILIHANRDSWIQVRDGNHILIERNLRVGDTYRVPDKAGLLMDTGNGAGLDIEVDGKQVPTLGAAVRNNVALDASRLAAGTAVPPIKYPPVNRDSPPPSAPSSPPPSP